MDSLSQIVLGAATGEAVLGRRLGNKALIWGAIAGTVPDLDVLGGVFLDPLANLAFHRGITHSVLFWVVGALLFAWPMSRSRRNDVGYLGWTGFFFATFATHVLLDCFTLYGTQVWAPFSNHRVSWSTIAVADPLYTFPFLAFLVALSRAPKGSERRRKWHRWAWGWSCAYLALTVVNKQHVDQIFAAALERQGIPAERMITTPTILNNVLWNATAESADAFYLGSYSLFDTSPVVFERVAKGWEHLDGKEDQLTVRELRWFSDGYLHVDPPSGADTLWHFSDLRFGSFTGKGEQPEDFIFRFQANEVGGNIEFIGAAGGPPPEKRDQFFPMFWDRLKGR